MKTHIYLKPIIGLFVILSMVAVAGCKHDNQTVDLEPTVYTVTFETDGGTQIDGQSVTAGEMVVKPQNPEKTGFEFDGWYTDSELTAAYDFTTEVTSDFTLYAKWKIIVLNVTFFTDGGTEIAAQEINYNEKATAPATDPTKENCTFDGWYTDKTFETEFDFETAITQDITIYAKWIVAEGKLEVKFETSGGSNISTQIIEPGAKATKPATDPTKAHYKFGGWYVDADCSLAFDFDTELTEATTIYARWIELYTVTFNTDGGSTIAAQEVEPGTPITEPSTAPAKSGYKFAGWYSDQTLTTSYNFSNGVNESFTLYAKWTPVYTITFSGADVPSQSVEKGQKATKPADPVRDDGILFGGWYINEACTTAFDFNSEIHENKILYAKWMDSWTVTFSAGDDGIISSQSVKNGNKVTKPTTPADKNNLSFDNWYSDAALTTLFDFNTPITKDTTIYAKWLPVFTITFDSVDGSEVDPIKVLQGKTATKPADPTRGSRPFVGWYLDSEYQTPFDFETTVIIGDLKLYAKWAMPEGVTDAITIKTEKAELDVTFVYETQYGMTRIYSFTCNDGTADWYLNNTLVKSNSATYNKSLSMFQKRGYCTVEARKIIDGIEYSWTRDISM